MDNSIFEEIDEEVKRENTIKFIKKHSKVILGVIIAIVIIIASYSTYLTNQRRESEVFTKKLMNVVYNYDGTLKSVERDLDHLIKNAPLEISNMAHIIKLGVKGDDISNELKEISKNKDYDIVLRDLAVLMFVSKTMDKMDSKEAINMLEEISTLDHPFRLSALELIGVLSLRDNNIEKAKSAFSAIESDKDAPKSMLNRIKLLNLK